MQDITAELIAAIDNLVVSHNGANVILRAYYGSDIWKQVPPAIFVRKLEGPPIENGDIGGKADVYEGRYDVSIICQTSPANPSIIAEVFLKDAANALQTRLRSLVTVGSAWAVRIVNDKPLPADEENGVLVFERVLTVRAQSVETF